jgi:hypothetical protein
MRERAPETLDALDALLGWSWRDGCEAWEKARASVDGVEGD